MSNKNNNLIFKGFAVMSAISLVMVAIMAPTNAEAYRAGSGFYTLSDNANYETSGPTITAPVIFSVSPNEIYVNSSAKTIAINGEGFNPSSMARFNSSNRPTTYVSPTRLNMQITAEDSKVLGNFLVTVFNPGTNGGFSNSVPMTVKKASTASYTGTVAKAPAKKATPTKAPTATKAVAENVVCAPATTDGGADGSNSSGSADTILAAALKGGDSFMPSSLLEWVFLFVFILLAVVLWRRMYVTDSERNAPLKHA